MTQKQLEKFDGYWPTDKGLSFVTERAVMHGTDLLHDLIDLDWMQLHYFSIKGKHGDPDKLKAMMVAWAGCSYPDPRIWNNRIAALAGTTRSTVNLAIGAATAVSEATLYGNRANKKCIDMFWRAHAYQQQGFSLTQFIANELASNRIIFGYGRPIRHGDERLQPMIKRLKALNLFEDPFIQMSLEIETILNEKKGLSLNISGITAALGVSLDFTPTEYHLFLSPVFTIGFTPCYMDALNKPQGCFFPLHCNRVKYTGAKIRNWDSSNSHVKINE